jgi:FkbM family methyltransferase
MTDLRRLYYSNRLCRAALQPAVSLRRQYLRWKLDSANQVCVRLGAIARQDLVVDVPEFDGQFKIGASSHLLHRLLAQGFYEPELAAWAKAHVDRHRDVIDVGANVGFFTVLLGRQLVGRRVLAIEPAASALSRLQWNVAANDLADRVVIFDGLAARESGLAELKVFEGMEEYSCAGVAAHQVIRDRVPKLEQIRKSTVDALVAEHGLNPGFMKIDVEGFEMEVLSGAALTLEMHRPLILSELSDSLLRKNGSSAEEVVEFLRKHRYSVTDPLYEHMPPGERDYADLVAIPMRA